MPFQFTLPTTSSFSFPLYFESNSHPSLPVCVSTHRGVLRDALKRHKRLPAHSQAVNISSILLSIGDYLPYLLALDRGLENQTVAGEEIDVVLKSTPSFEWRATLSCSMIPGREPIRQKLNSLEYEVYFVLSTQAYANTLSSRAVLQPLYSSASSSPSQEQRTTAIQAATKYLLTAASIHSYLSTRSDSLSISPPCTDISGSTFRALSCLALAEATLLAVLKDDPYPAAVAQDRNKNDKEWMIKAPAIPKVRAHLFARLCLSASEHAARAHSILNNPSAKGQANIDDDLLKYIEDVRRTGRGKACRFLAIDADLGGNTGQAIAWLYAGLHALGFPVSTSSPNKGGSGSSLSKLHKEWASKREDRRIEKGTAWSGNTDAGRAEEARVCDMLDAKWSRQNDLVNTQVVPPWMPLMACMPSGRDIHVVKDLVLPELDAPTVRRMRAPPSPGAGDGEAEGDSSDDEQERMMGGMVGTFPGTREDYGLGGARGNGNGSGSECGSAYY